MEARCPVETLKVFIAEDSLGIRERLIELIGEIDRASVVGVAETPADAISGILNTRPDLVVLDYQLLGGTGVEVMQAVLPKVPTMIFAVLSNHASPQYRRTCQKAGASWFFDKSTEFGRIKHVIAGLAPASEITGCTQTAR